MKESKTNYVICGLPDSGQKELYTLLKDNLSKNTHLMSRDYQY